MNSFFNQQNGISSDNLCVSQKIERGLDAVIIIYSLLDNHPASGLCEDFIKDKTGWFTTPFTLFEAKSILTKVYGIDNVLVSQKLEQFARGPIHIFEVDFNITLNSMKMADMLYIDLTDAVLLQTALKHNASSLATDDKKLIQACESLGIKVETPIDDLIRQQMITWEQDNLPEKGLSRILFHIRNWLLKKDYGQIADDFWEQTSKGNHLP
jgi:predicted nucleic acid-binding protein